MRLNLTTATSFLTLCVAGISAAPGCQHPMQPTAREADERGQSLQIVNGVSPCKLQIERCQSLQIDIEL